MIRAIGTLCVLLSFAAGSVPVGAQDPPPAPIKVASIDLPFAATRIAVSADGERAAVWDVPRNLGDFQSLAIIDLRQHKLVSQAILQTPLLDVVVGTDIYVADAKAISRLSADRLEPLAVFEYAGVQELGRPSREPLRLLLVANDRLSVGPRTRLALPDLTLIENYDHDINTAEGWLEGRSGFGWFLEGVLWDDAMSKPLLLAWPYEFERVPFSYSSREPGEFQPAAGTWHPFSTKLNQRPERGILVPTTSPDIAATLGVFEGKGEFHLVSFRLDNGKFIANVPIASSNTKPGIVASSPRSPLELNTPRNINSPAGVYGIATGGGKFAALLLGRVYVGPLNPLQGDAASVPFHIVPRQSTFVLPTDQPVTIRYESPGATRFRLSSRILGSNNVAIEITSETGEFTLSVSESLANLLDNAAGLAANMNKGRDISDNHRRAEFYAGPSRSAFRRLFGREANGIPLTIDIQVTADGKDFETAVLRHDFLVEVPLQQFEDALDLKYPAARSPWKKPAEEFDLTNYPASASPPAGRDTWRTYLRELWETPHPEPTGEALRDAALQAKAAGDKRLHDRFVKWIADNQWRTWTDVDGREAEALLVQYFAGQVSLRTRQGADVTFEETKLSKADREFLEGTTEHVTPNDSDAWRTFVFSEAARAANQFHTARKTLPPRALTDDAGQPRLSWRVLLLDELGYSELSALFRFDEPWNSEHNLALIPFMPNVFAVDAAAAKAGKTTLVTVFSPLSAMPTRGVMAMSSFGVEMHATVIFVEAVGSRATQWTKPFDLELYEFTDPSAVVRSRDGQILVGLLNGQTFRLPADQSSDDWRFAVNRGDGRRAFESPLP